VEQSRKKIKSFNMIPMYFMTHDLRPNTCRRDGKFHLAYYYCDDVEFFLLAATTLFRVQAVTVDAKPS